MDNETISGAATVAGAGTAAVTAKESVMTRIKAILSGVATDIEHDEEAIVAWVKEKL